MIVRKASPMRYILAAVLAVAAAGPAAPAPQREAGKLDSGGKGSHPRKPESKLILGKPAVSRDRIMNFPIEFTAAPGETVGLLRGQITFPEGAWKFVKVEPISGSRLKVSAKQIKRGTGKGSEAAFDLTISAGTHVIKDGVIATLQLSAPQQEDSPPVLPVAHILATAPPETQEVTSPSAEPFALPPEPPPNPGVACFFFSH